VRGRLGWYVIRVEQRRSVPPPSFEEAHDSLRRGLTEQAVRQAVAQARSEASVQQFNLDGSSMTDQGRALLPYLPGLPDD
jgi:parvulin-like peptidyl-prolyl isomerase